MNLSRTNRWTIRAFSAVFLFLITLATSGVVQAITGAGTPCDSCGARCYQYYAGIPKSQGGCKLPSGMLDYACLQLKCSFPYTPGSWCYGCIDTDVDYTDCENPNCWEFGNINGGTLCSNACFGAGCAAGTDGSPTRTCGQVQQLCTPAGTSVSCSKCGCVQ